MHVLVNTYGIVCFFAQLTSGLMMENEPKPQVRKIPFESGVFIRREKNN